MYKEVKHAVDVFHRIAFGTKKNGNKFVSENKLANFISVLTELLLARYKGSWYPENPERGSGYRCIRVNQQCVDPTVVESMKKADIVLPKNVIPTELTIWVDPGVVSIRIGEEGSIGSEIVDEEVYEMSRKSKVQSRSGSESDEGFSSSRSSSPSSERSASASPPAKMSPTSSPSPPLEYNPYSPPRRHLPPPSHQSPKRLSPTAQLFQPAASPQSRSMMLQEQLTRTSSPQEEVFQSFNPTIPVSSSQQQGSYLRPRSLFPTQEHGSMSQSSIVKGYGKMNFNAYSMPVNHGGNLPLAHSNYDIPVMC